MISLSTCRTSPGRVGRGQLNSPPAPMTPPASGAPPSTSSFMVIAAVCQPLAARPPKIGFRRRLVKMEGLRIELQRRRP